MSKTNAGFQFQTSFVSQTGTFADTTLFTPSADGDYLVSVYVENTTGSATVSSVLKWTDNAGAQSATVSAAATSGNKVVAIHALSGQAVTVNGSDFGGAQTYSVYVTARSFT